LGEGGGGRQDPLTLQGGGRGNRHNPHYLFALGEPLTLGTRPAAFSLTLNLIKQRQKRNKQVVKNHSQRSLGTSELGANRLLSYSYNSLY
jgi:hypothetical protein